MKRFGMTAMISMLLLFFLFGFMVLFVSGRTTGYLKQMKEQKTKLRAEESLDNAQQELERTLEKETKEFAMTTYEELLLSIEQKQTPVLDEEAAEETYKSHFVSKMEQIYTKDMQEAYNRLNAYLPKLETGVLEIDETKPFYFEVLSDEKTNAVNGCALRGITILYDNGGDYQKSRTYDFIIHIPNTCFYNGNDELFEYSLVANKGIYITGKTSSIVGNVFAGEHQVGENRKAEAGYGEKNIFGGLNILSTQLGVQAEKIVSAGDINLKGSFVLFGSQQEPASIYAEHVNLMNGYPTKSDYNIEGTEFLRDGTEQADDGFAQICDMVKEASGKLYKLEDYYDSDNDETYSGSYRKILSASDVTISEDFTGILLTYGNVIVEADCNVEGMIFAGDRIYIQGNNNIVSNKEILQSIISEEYAENSAGSDFDISHKAMDYLAGLSFKGLYDENFSYVEMLQKSY